MSMNNMIAMSFFMQDIQPATYIPPSYNNLLFTMLNLNKISYVLFYGEFDLRIIRLIKLEISVVISDKFDVKSFNLFDVYLLCQLAG